MQLAVPKTVAILVSNRRLYQTPKIRLQSSDVLFKHNLCYLGVQLDINLAFSQHVMHIRDKATQTE